MNQIACPVLEPKEAFPLPQAIVRQIETLREARLQAYAEEPFRTGQRETNTGLEQGVDDLLDSLHNLYHLERLAGFEANGGHISVEADRILIADHAEIYARMRERLAGPNAGALAPIPAGALPVEVY